MDSVKGGQILITRVPSSFAVTRIGHPVIFRFKTYFSCCFHLFEINTNAAQFHKETEFWREKFYGHFPSRNRTPLHPAISILHIANCSYFPRRLKLLKRLFLRNIFEKLFSKHSVGFLLQIYVRRNQGLTFWRRNYFFFNFSTFCI